MQPVEYNGLEIHKGAAFTFSFRLSRAGSYIDPTDVVFTASDKPGGTLKARRNFADSPADLPVDGDDVWTVTLSEEETAALDCASLYFVVDATEDGLKQRWIIGKILVFEDAVAGS